MDEEIEREALKEANVADVLAYGAREGLSLTGHIQAATRMAFARLIAAGYRKHPAPDVADAVDEAARTVSDYADLDRAIAGVLFDVMNYPESVRARMLGQNIRPLTEKLIDAVLATGYRKEKR